MARPLEEARCVDENDPLDPLFDILADGATGESQKGEFLLDMIRDSGAECCCGDIGAVPSLLCVGLEFKFEFEFGSAGSGLRLGFGLNSGSMRIELRRRSNSSAF